MANILIVEDEKNMQDIIAKFMRKGGHNCFTADDGVDALVVLKNQAVDLMILDVMIPHLDGFSVCRTARQMSSLPIIMLTEKQLWLFTDLKPVNSVSRGRELYNGGKQEIFPYQPTTTVTG